MRNLIFFFLSLKISEQTKSPHPQNQKANKQFTHYFFVPFPSLRPRGKVRHSNTSQSVSNRMKQVLPEPLPKILGNWCLRESNNHIIPKAARRGAPATTGGALVPSPAQVVQIPLIFTPQWCWCNPDAQLGLLTPWKITSCHGKTTKVLCQKGRGPGAGDIPVMNFLHWQSPARSPKIRVMSINTPCTAPRPNLILH